MSSSGRAFAELAVVRRNGFVESRHFGSVAAVHPDGSVALALGDPTATVLPRSSAKPLQALGCLRAGAPLTGPALAIAAGSHTGQDAHVSVARAILGSVGLTEEALRCPADWPEDRASRERLIRDGAAARPIWMNCSGKHAAMLAACVVAGWPTDGYRRADHPLHRVIRTALEQAAEEPVTHVAVDGCGAPLLGTSLTGLARAIRSLVVAETASAPRSVADAMREHPFYVGGSGHPNTEFMRLVPGTICKGGAEGVIAAAGPAGHAVAVKVIDGSPRATTLIALAVLGSLGVETSGAGSLTAPPVLGGGEPVGAIELADELRDALRGPRRSDALRGPRRSDAPDVP